MQSQELFKDVPLLLIWLETASYSVYYTLYKRKHPNSLKIHQKVIKKSLKRSFYRFSLGLRRRKKDLGWFWVTFREFRPKPGGGYGKPEILVGIPILNWTCAPNLSGVPCPPPGGGSWGGVLGSIYQWFDIRLSLYSVLGGGFGSIYQWFDIRLSLYRVSIRYNYHFSYKIITIWYKIITV
jgi:hypothetical protein